MNTPSNQPAGSSFGLEQARVAAAFALLGFEIVRWRGDTATVRRRDERLDVSLPTITSMLPAEAPGFDQRRLALELATVLNYPAPDELVLDLELIRPLLRPVLVDRSELEGPRRAMCRRDAFGHLLLAASVGVAPRAALITTRHIDAWGVAFDQILHTAFENLRAALGPAHVKPSDDDGIIEITHPDEPASSACFILDLFIPGYSDDRGALFSVPSRNTILALPVVEGAGAGRFAKLVQKTHAHLQQNPDDQLSEQVYWAHHGMADELSMTRIEEGGRKRVHMQAEGVMGDLLRLLGEID